MSPYHGEGKRPLGEQVSEILASSGSMLPKGLHDALALITDHIEALERGVQVRHSDESI